MHPVSPDSLKLIPAAKTSLDKQNESKNEIMVPGMRTKVVLIKLVKGIFVLGGDICAKGKESGRRGLGEVVKVEGHLCAARQGNSGTIVLSWLDTVERDTHISSVLGEGHSAKLKVKQTANHVALTNAITVRLAGGTRIGTSLVVNVSTVCVKSPRLTIGTKALGVLLYRSQKEPVRISIKR
jgi:hypothetical protein